MSDTKFIRHDLSKMKIEHYGRTDALIQAELALECFADMYDSLLDLYKTLLIELDLDKDAMSRNSESLKAAEKALAKARGDKDEISI